MPPNSGNSPSSEDVPLASSASSSGQSTTSSDLNKSYSPSPETVSGTPPALPPRPPNLSIPRERNTPIQRHIANSYTREAQLSRQSNSSISSLQRPPSSSPNLQTPHHHHHSPHLPPPPLPPPPLAPPVPEELNCSNQNHGITSVRMNGGQPRSLCHNMGKKYVLMCGLCGGLCLALGIMYIVIFFLLDRYTTSLHYFQTMPTWVPSIPLLVTGTLISSFARRGNRNNYLVKICGLLCLICAVLCVVITVTTTVIHMNRLQTLRECVYQSVTKTCTCFAGILDPLSRDPGMHYVFGGTQNCDVIHGILYSCLRALFGISVIGILVCIFSCMLVYQISSHEKKKEYWAQLEHRCRFLHSHSQHPHQMRGTGAGSRFPPHATLVPNSISGNMIHTPGSMCECCSPHEDENLWTTQSSRGANLYSPNPVLAPLQSHMQGNGERTSSNLGPQTSSSNVVQSQSFSSLRSFRNWLPSFGRAANPASSSSNRVPSNSGPTQPTNESTNDGNPGQGSNHPWRRSVQMPAEATYGFHQRVYPASCHYLSSLLNPTHGLTLPQYVWDPPPPYSNPNPHEDQCTSEGADASVPNPNGNGQSGNQISTEPRSANMAANNCQGGMAGSNPGSNPGQNNHAQEHHHQQPAQSPMSAMPTSTSSASSPSSSTPRTSKSGLLPSLPAPPQNGDVITEDLTIHSGMHLYEKAGNGTYSLPSRRVKKRKPAANDFTKSVTDLATPSSLNEEEVLVQEVRQKLNALLLYKYQHSKTTKDLAEVRQALQSLQTGGNRNIYGKIPLSEARKHSFPNLGMSSLVRNKGGAHPAGSTSRNRNSTSSGTSSVENKYETIEKSLSPYKISNNAINNNPEPTTSSPSVAPHPPNVNISIRKQLQLNHNGSACQSPPMESPSKLTLQKLLQLAASSPASSGSPLPRDLALYQREGELGGFGGRFSALSSPASSSSHYAQISPLRGIGMPRMTPTYFQELHRQDVLHNHPTRNQSPLAMKATNTHLVTASSESRLATNDLAQGNSHPGQNLLKQVSQSAIQLNNQNLLKLQEIKWCFQPQNRYDLNDNISKSDPKIAQKVDLQTAATGHPLRVGHQHGGLSRVARSVPGSANQTPVKHVMPDCVYLRPEQNIPEIFASTNFKPIGGGGDERSRLSDPKNKRIPNTRISRDDIVVTMRSAHV